MKIHKTVTITARTLKKLKACEDGLANVLPLLPVKISTDPQDNIKLAMQLMKPRPYGGAGFDSAPAENLDWLASKVLVGPEGDSYSEDVHPDYHTYPGPDNTGEPTKSYFDVRADAHLVAQGLAMIADKLLSDRGR